MWSNLASSIAGIVTSSINGDWGTLASSIVETVGAAADILSGIDWSALGSASSGADATTVTSVVDTVTSTTETVASTVASTTESVAATAAAAA